MFVSYDIVVIAIGFDDGVLSQWTVYMSPVLISWQLIIIILFLDKINVHPISFLFLRKNPILFSNYIGIELNQTCSSSCNIFMSSFHYVGQSKKKRNSYVADVIVYDYVLWIPIKTKGMLKTWGIEKMSQTDRNELCRQSSDSLLLIHAFQQQK